MPNTIEFWSRGAEAFKVVGFVIAGLGVLIAVLGWNFSARASALKDEASKVAKAASDKAIAEANATAATANERAALADLETQRLKKQLAWREASPAQVETIRNALKNAPMEVTMSWVSGDPEGSEFAQRLGRVFMDSGCTISAFAPMGFLGEEPHGLSLSGSEQKELDLLSGALEKAGLGPVTIKVSSRKPDETKYFTHVMIGYRSAPVLETK